MKNKKNIIFILAIMFLGAGTTLAYLSSTGIIRNVFNTASYETVIQEEFNSPSNWTPGDTTPKALVVRNEGDAPVYARVCIEDSWKALDETILPNFNTTLNEKMAIINLANESDWMYSHDDVNDRDCYIYKSVINGNSASSSFMESVTYNPNYSGGIICTTNEVTHTNECKSSNSGYDGAEYTLNLIIETIQKQGINESGWGFGYSSNGETYNYEDATSTLSGSSYRNFLRKAATDNGIKTQIGLKLDEDEYYITGGDTTSYNDNKEVLNEIFGSTNCTETNETYKTYTCSKDTLQAVIKSTGEVSLTDNVQVARIDQNGIASIEIDRTLYNVMRLAASEGTYAKEYTGAHQDSISGVGNKKIYHWYAPNNSTGNSLANEILDKNNVIFANHCWQMIRTTDTGGVKMIYNGEPENNQCLSTRGNHVGIVGTNGSTKNLDGDYMYGTSYTYDETNSTFTLTGTKITSRWSDSTYKTLFGKYTCASSTDTCATLYQVNGYSSSTTAYTTSYTVANTVHYSQIGTTTFNANNRSPAMVGYMYNGVYNYKTYATTATQNLTAINTIISTYIPIVATNKYSKTINFTGSTYELVDPILGSDIPETDYSGYYTFRSATIITGTQPSYIVGLSSGTSYYTIQLSVTKQKSDFDIMIGDSIVDNGDNTYTISNPTRVSVDDWYSNYANYVNKYTCGDVTKTCSSPMYLTTTTKTNYTYLNAGEKILIAKGRNGLYLTDTHIVRKDELVINSSNYSDYKYTCNDTSSTCTESNLRMISGYTTSGYNYVPNHYWGSSVTWDGTNYTLVDPIGIENYNNTTNLSTHHYMCLDNGLKVCSTVAYLYHYTGSGSMYYVLLENGKEIDDALNEMLYNDDVNKFNSTIKGNIDAWYKHNMLPYDEYLEDTIFCNDRSMNNASTNGWNPNGGSLSAYMYFKEYNSTTDLSCTNETDKFSVSNDKAKLTYKVGLMSNPEMNLLNNSNIRKTGQWYWLASPNYFYNSSANGRHVNPNGSLSSDNVNLEDGARPAISLVSDIKYISGDGSMANPYIVLTD
ncbi:MAG: BsaA family SipW-dependent biofilm matrix protein [Bacilli bacterium]|nr:BsaA family SipW-dependent biofilm matrix protein [Bacilli bacterium]